MRDALVGSVNTWLAAHAARDRRSAKDEGHLRADADEEQMLFEIHGLILALHYEARFLRNPGADRPRARAGFERIAAGCRRRARCRAAPATPDSIPVLCIPLQGVFHAQPTPRPCATCSS